jgi:hypothetical protein
VVWRNLKEELRPKFEAALQFIFVEMEKQPLRQRHVLKSLVAVDTQSPFDRITFKTKPSPNSLHDIFPTMKTNQCCRVQMVLTFMAPATYDSRRLELARTQTTRAKFHVGLARLNSSPAPNT